MAKDMSTQIKVLVANRIREIRVKRGFSQESLALEAGLDRTYINSVENGRRNISIQSLAKITNALETSFKEFFSNSTFNKQGLY